MIKHGQAWSSSFKYDHAWSTMIKDDQVHMVIDHH